LTFLNYTPSPNAPAGLLVSPSLPRGHHRSTTGARIVNMVQVSVVDLYHVVNLGIYIHHDLWYARDIGRGATLLLRAGAAVSCADRFIIMLLLDSYVILRMLFFPQG
jgi:hypothetical protein